MNEMQFSTDTKSKVTNIPKNIMLQKLFSYLKGKEGWLTASFELNLDDYLAYKKIDTESN